MIPNEPQITPKLVAEHGLKPDEYERFRALIGRDPSFTELGIVSAMWNEHCSYKSSKAHLRGLPTKAPWVIQGPGENAASSISAAASPASSRWRATITPPSSSPIRERRPASAAFCATSSPWARVRSPASMRSVSAIRNIRRRGRWSRASSPVSAATAIPSGCRLSAARSGFTRATTATFSSTPWLSASPRRTRSSTPRRPASAAPLFISARRPAATEFMAPPWLRPSSARIPRRSGRPCRLEACLEIMRKGCVIAIQDMGAAGLTCSAVEMGAKGDLGVTLDLDRVPTREAAMTAYEMMLSESQERMLMVLKPEKEKEAEAIFRKWGLDFAVVGETTGSKRFIVRYAGDVMADLPIKELGDEAPEYNRPFVEPKKLPVLEAKSLPYSGSIKQALEKLIASPDLCSKRWVWEQYDHLILNNTVQRPGGDAAVVRIHDGPKALALTTDVTPRYCEADPFEGGKQAVAEAWRNLTAVGAKPLAVTDNLNFGNPERPEIMGQFVYCVRGISEACKALDFPVVSGNVSLYNETNGRAILPTPTIGGVGLLDDLAKSATLAFKAEGETILLVGETTGWLGQSSFLATVLGREEGAPPPVDLAVEKRNGDFVRQLIAEASVTAAHDLSDGGLLVALAEMAMASNIGATLDSPPAGMPAHAFWFGEDQARYALTAKPADVPRIVAAAGDNGVPLRVVGTTGGRQLTTSGEDPILVSTLQALFEEWLPAYMAGAATG